MKRDKIQVGDTIEVGYQQYVVTSIEEDSYTAAPVSTVLDIMRGLEAFGLHPDKYEAIERTPSYCRVTFKNDNA